jgi:hypothetical protein
MGELVVARRALEGDQQLAQQRDQLGELPAIEGGEQPVLGRDVGRGDAVEELVARRSERDQGVAPVPGSSGLGLR